MNENMLGLIEPYGVLTVKYLIDVVGAVVLLVAGWMIGGWVRRLIRRSLSRVKRVDVTLTAFLSNLARYLVLILVLVAVLAQFGVQTASILAVLGTIGLGVGLALQGTLSNIAAGVMLLLLRPFKIGDYIDASGAAGTVNEIGLFATLLTTYDGVFLAVPNGQVWNSAIKNYSRLPTRRLDVAIGVGYDDDLDKALAALLKLLEDDQRVLKDPGPQVMVLELGDSSVNLNLRCWTNAGDYWDLQFDLNKASKECVEAIGCTIPFPQRDIHLIADGPAMSAAAGGAAVGRAAAG